MVWVYGTWGRHLWGSESRGGGPVLLDASEPQACEHVFVREYSFTVTEHDPAKPWLIVGREHRTVGSE